MPSLGNLWYQAMLKDMTRFVMETHYFDTGRQRAIHTLMDILN